MKLQSHGLIFMHTNVDQSFDIFATVHPLITESLAPRIAWHRCHMNAKLFIASLSACLFVQLRLLDPIKWILRKYLVCR